MISHVGENSGSNKRAHCTEPVFPEVAVSVNDSYHLMIEDYFSRQTINDNITHRERMLTVQFWPFICLQGHMPGFKQH